MGARNRSWRRQRGVRAEPDWDLMRRACDGQLTAAERAQLPRLVRAGGGEEKDEGMESGEGEGEMQRGLFDAD